MVCDCEELNNKKEKLSRNHLAKGENIYTPLTFLSPSSSIVPQPLSLPKQYSLEFLQNKTIETGPALPLKSQPKL